MGSSVYETGQRIAVTPYSLLVKQSQVLLKVKVFLARFHSYIKTVAILISTLTFAWPLVLSSQVVRVVWASNSACGSNCNGTLVCQKARQHSDSVYQQEYCVQELDLRLLL